MKWNPEDYAKNSDAQLKWARELTENLDLQGGESILDVGCGDGKITATLAESVPNGRVVGVDSSPEAIAYANRTYPSAQYPNLSFACIDARSLNFDRQFDRCFSNATLHWVDNHQGFLAGAHRSLRQGGKLVISCGGEGNAAEVLQVFLELATHPSWQSYFDRFENPYFFYSDRDYALWLGQASFQIERLELVPKDMTQVGKEGLAGWIRTTWMPFTERVPANKRDDFIDRFADAYLAKIPLDDRGLVHIAMVRLEAVAIAI